MGLTVPVSHGGAQLETQKAETYLSYDLGEISQDQYRERRVKLGTAITEQNHENYDLLAEYPV